MGPSGQVVFVGAGPGTPDLLTLAGAKAIRSADLLLYAGSLVHSDIIDLAKPGAEKHNSASLTLRECVEIMRDGVERGWLVARVHTGDPSIFGTLAEQTRELDRLGISWKVIPGVTAATAAAACAGISFTVPELAQGLVICRVEGRTKIPPEMDMASLAAHKMPMAIYLSGKLVSKMRSAFLKELLGATPVLCAKRAGWPEGRLVWTTLENLERCVEEEKLQEHTVFIVLPGRDREGAQTNSRLYSADFSHAFRKGDG